MSEAKLWFNSIEVSRCEVQKLHRVQPTGSGGMMSRSFRAKQWHFGLMCFCNVFSSFHFFLLLVVIIEVVAGHGVSERETMLYLPEKSHLQSITSFFLINDSSLLVLQHFSQFLSCELITCDSTSHRKWIFIICNLWFWDDCGTLNSCHSNS